MKLLRSAMFAIVLATIFYSCDPARNKATQAGTKDTTDVRGSESVRTKDSIQTALKDSSGLSGSSTASGSHQDSAGKPQKKQ
jgi:hypothetical protein